MAVTSTRSNIRKSGIKQKAFYFELPNMRIKIPVALFFLIGIVLGAIMANKNIMLFNEESMDTFLGKISDGTFTSSDTIGTSILKHGKYVAAIWLCGFGAPGFFLAPSVMAFKGFSLGYTTAVLVKTLKLSGVALSIVSYLPQNLILVPVYFFLTCFSVKFVLDKYNQPISYKDRLKREKERKLTEYIIILAISFILVVIAAVLEIYLVPLLLRLFGILN